MKQFESGRSMVEMLGTLAIIGVLSIGGIAGYKYGMDKYRANQTINDVMLMGVDIITQLSQQRTQAPVLSSDYGTKTTAGYDFTVVQNPEDETQYGIQITGVPASICKQVGDGLKQTVAVYVGNEDYTSDTETDPCDESDSNTMEFYFEPITTEFGECKTDTDCGTNKYCDMGLCFDGLRPEITARVFDKACTSDAECNTGWNVNCSSCDTNLGYCIETREMQNKSCLLENGTTGKCGAGECVPTGCTYDTNKCGNKEYCASPNTSNEEAFPNNETGSCILGTARFSVIKINLKTYHVSNTPLSLWDANAGCKSLGYDGLIDIEDLLIGWTETDGGNCEKTELAKVLEDALPYAHVWTKRPCEGNTSCLYNGVYTVSLYSNGAWPNYSPSSTHPIAVCK